ncbi:MAG: hypothetical protein ACFFCS_21940 [Candidatus Hodarchaeota archaeon]
MSCQVVPSRLLAFRLVFHVKKGMNRCTIGMFFMKFAEKNRKLFVKEKVYIQRCGIYSVLEQERTGGID